jgi:two-component system, chemotaxis family, chemotaxis protein CheY
MTLEPGAPTSAPQRWARIRPEHQRDYPASYLGQWFRVVERHDPDIPSIPDHIWLDLAGGAKRVPGSHFEIAERSKRRILVVDDDQGIRQTLQIALCNAGYDVIQARDGEEATRLWHETGPDLVITDIHMPQKSGLLLIEDLRAHSAATPVIAMTDGGPGTDYKLLGLAKILGAVRTVTKPFTLDEMVQAVNRELGSP